MWELSHAHAPSAHKNGYFEAELAPLEVKVKKAKEMFASDEHPRETTLEKLAKLPPVFKENGTVSAGNASVRALLCTLYHCNAADQSHFTYMATLH